MDSEQGGGRGDYGNQSALLGSGSLGHKLTSGHCCILHLIDSQLLRLGCNVAKTKHLSQGQRSTIQQTKSVNSATAISDTVVRCNANKFGTLCSRPQSLCLRR